MTCHQSCEGEGNENPEPRFDSIETEKALAVFAVAVLERSRQVDFRSVINGFAAEKIACQSFVYRPAFFAVVFRLRLRACVLRASEAFLLR